jgi:hypothetical protein
MSEGNPDKNIQSNSRSKVNIGEAEMAVALALFLLGQV